MTGTEGAFEAYFRTVADVDALRASEVVLELLDDGTPVERITREVLGPAQERVGQLWEEGRWTVADEHAATAVTETALSALSTAARRRSGRDDRHVVVACAEGEWHTLPARMAAAVASSAGARVTFLGPSMPADDLHRRLAAGDVDVLALSCTLAPNLLGAARCVRAAHDAGVPVLAGGRAFGTTPQRAHAVGADGWAPEPAALTAPPPALAGRGVVVPAEVVLLDALEDGTVAMACDRLVAALPRTLSAYGQVRLRQELHWTGRYTGAAVLTDDETVLDELFAWRARLAAGRDPADLVTCAHVLADAVEPFAATGAGFLRAAADRLVAGRPA